MMSAGVPIQRSMVGVKVVPSTVRTSAEARLKATFVCMAERILSVSPAPK